MQSFSGVDKGDIESLVSFLAPFQELTEVEHHVCRAYADFAATLALGDVFVGDGWYEPAEKDPGKYITSDGE